MAASSSFTLAGRLRAGETVHAGWCSLGSPIVAESIARAGFAAVVADMQHGMWDAASLVHAIGGIHHGGGAAIVRVPLSDFASVSRALDFGAEAVIAPMINSADDARAFVAAAKYPPLGARSWGAHRATMIGQIPDQKDYLREANTLTLTLAMIETKAALANVEAIAAVPGIDMLFIGPSDLSIALSDGAALDPHSVAVESAIDKIVAAAKNAGKYVGLYCTNAERVLACGKRGIRFFAIGSDLGFLRAGASAQIKALAAR